MASLSPSFNPGCVLPGHLFYKFGITESDWYRIKQSIDSKCRTAWRRKQRGQSLAVKSFSRRTPSSSSYSTSGTLCAESSEWCGGDSRGVGPAPPAAPPPRGDCQPGSVHTPWMSCLRTTVGAGVGFPERRAVPGLAASSCVASSLRRVTEHTAGLLSLLVSVWGL